VMEYDAVIVALCTMGEQRKHENDIFGNPKSTSTVRYSTPKSNNAILSLAHMVWYMYLYTRSRRQAPESITLFWLVPLRIAFCTSKSLHLPSHSEPPPLTSAAKTSFSAPTSLLQPNLMTSPWPPASKLKSYSSPCTITNKSVSNQSSIYNNLFHALPSTPHHTIPPSSTLRPSSSPLPSPPSLQPKAKQSKAAKPSASPPQPQKIGKTHVE